MKFSFNRITEIIYSLVGAEEKRDMLLGSGITFGMKFLGMGLSYLSLLVVARLYGADVMGGLALALVVYNIFSLPGACGARDAIVRFIAESVVVEGDSAFGDTYVRLVTFFLPLSFVTGCSLFVGSGFLAQAIFNKPELAVSFRLMAIAVPVGTVSFTNIATLRGLKRIAESSFLAIVLPVALNLLLIFVFSFIVGKTVEAVVLAHLLSLALCILAGLLFLSRKKGLSTNNRCKSGLSYRRILSVSAPMFVSSGMLLVFGWADTFMLGVFRSTEAVGVYRVAFKIAALSAFSLDAVGSIAAAQFVAANTKEDKTLLRNVVTHSSKLIFWLACPVIILVSVFSVYVMQAFGGEFMEGLLCLRILILAQGFNVICGLVGVLLNICGGQRQYRNAMIGASLLNVILNLWLIPLYGVSGAAIATAISIVTGNVFAAIVAYRMFGFWVGFRFGKQE